MFVCCGRKRAVPLRRVYTFLERWTAGCTYQTTADKNWQNTGYTGPQVLDIECDPEDDQVLYITEVDIPPTTGTKVLISDTRGASFSLFNNGLARAGLPADLSYSRGPRPQLLLATETGSYSKDLSYAYDAWLSSNLTAQPFLPFRDCVRLTEKMISTDRCGDAGPLTTIPLSGIPEANLWIGQIPCQGLNLVFLGTSFGTTKTGIGASVIGMTHWLTLGMEGFKTPECAAVSPGENNVYSTLMSVADERAGGTGATMNNRTQTLDQTPQGVVNKTYEVWISQGSDPFPFEPVHDCLRFTQQTISMDGCAETGLFAEYPLFGMSGLTFWIGQLPCNGEDLLLTGTSFDGAHLFLGGNVISGSGQSPGFSMAVEGFENPICSITP